LFRVWQYTDAWSTLWNWGVRGKGSKNGIVKGIALVMKVEGGDWRDNFGCASSQGAPAHFLAKCSVM
jgi:hypothetical protein